MFVSLNEKAAIVTGAASGIGLATVRRFLEAGAAGVVAVDLAPQPSESLQALDGSRLRYIGGDVGDERTAEALATADEVAGFLTYLASDLASFFTGTVLMMDGGFTAR